MIVRVSHGPDGVITRREVLSYREHDGHQGVVAIEKLQKQYPESGWNPEYGPWARDAQGQLYTFVAK